MCQRTQCTLLVTFIVCSRVKKNTVYYMARKMTPKTWWVEWKSSKICCHYRSVFFWGGEHTVTVSHLSLSCRLSLLCKPAANFSCRCFIAPRWSFCYPSLVGYICLKDNYIYLCACPSVLAPCVSQLLSVSHCRTFSWIAGLSLFST